MKIMIISVLPLVGFLFLFSGCTSLNKGLDKTGEAARGVGKPVAKVLKVPQSVAEGGAEEMAEEENAENPFNR